MKKVYLAIAFLLLSSYRCSAMELSRNMQPSSSLECMFQKNIGGFVLSIFSRGNKEHINLLKNISNPTRKTDLKIFLAQADITEENNKINEQLCLISKLDERDIGEKPGNILDLFLYTTVKNNLNAEKYEKAFSRLEQSYLSILLKKGAQSIGLTKLLVHAMLTSQVGDLNRDQQLLIKNLHRRAVSKIDIGEFLLSDKRITRDTINNKLSFEIEAAATTYALGKHTPLELFLLWKSSKIDEEQTIEENAFSPVQTQCLFHLLQLGATNIMMEKLLQIGIYIEIQKTKAVLFCLQPKVCTEITKQLNEWLETLKKKEQ